MDEFPVATSPAPGIMGVDWENRVDFERLRQLPARPRAGSMLEASDLGAVLLFETSQHPLRHRAPTSATGRSTRASARRSSPATGRPADLGLRVGGEGPPPAAPAAVRRENSVGGNTGLQGAIAPASACTRARPREITAVLEEDGVADMPLGVDVAETAVFLALAGARGSTSATASR